MGNTNRISTVDGYTGSVICYKSNNNLTGKRAPELLLLSAEIGLTTVTCEGRGRSLWKGLLVAEQ